jgi:histidine triad (HIT) family protein
MGDTGDASRDEDCIFCRIASGDLPADIVHETERTVAFRDLQPQAPTHVLVIPRSHHANVAALAAAEPETAVALVGAAAAVAEQEGVGDGYRLVFNTGAGAQQSVFHVHGHVIGGRSLTWPPG